MGYIGFQDSTKGGLGIKTDRIGILTFSFAVAGFSSGAEVSNRLGADSAFAATSLPSSATCVSITLAAESGFAAKSSSSSDSPSDGH
jgi:hypothetical protein